MRWGSSQGVRLYYRDEDEQDLYFREFLTHERTIERRQSDATIAIRVAEQRPSGLGRLFTVAGLPFAKVFWGANRSTPAVAKER
jgi:hypothetical protein